MTLKQKAWSWSSVLCILVALTWCLWPPAVVVLAEAPLFNFFFPVCHLFEWVKTCLLPFLSNGLGYLPELSLAKTRFLCEEIKLWVASNFPVTCWAHPHCVQTSQLLPLWLYPFFFNYSGLPCLPSLTCTFAQLSCPQGRMYNPILLSYHFSGFCCLGFVHHALAFSSPPLS